jgi:hypothetical protein
VRIGAIAGLAMLALGLVVAAGLERQAATP